jgi:hypothetical protein
MTGDAFADPTEIGLRSRRPRWGVVLGVASAVVVVAAVVIPHFTARRSVYRNDTSAIATLRNLVNVQADFRKRAAVDVDGDGRGDFGHILELVGELGPRLDARGLRRRVPLTPPMLSPVLANVNRAGVVAKSGYCFAVFLPGRDGGWVAERGPSYERQPTSTPPCGGGGCRGQVPAVAPWTPGDPLDLDAPWPEDTEHPEDALVAEVDADVAEIEWLAVAWPAAYGNSGSVAFLATSGGAVYRTGNESGRLNGSQAIPSEPSQLLPSPWAPGTPLPRDRFTARDGTVWVETK